MSNSLRCFVAVDFRIPRPVRELVEQLGGFGRAVRPVAVENLHLTLKFLGNVEPEGVADVAAAVEQAQRGVDSLAFDLHGLGAFPNADRPSVVWVGVRPEEQIAALAAEVARRLEGLGFPPERRAFHPHLTVARVKSRPDAGLFELLETDVDRPFGPVTVERLVLYQSETGPRGSVYTPLATFPLEGAEG